MPKSCVTLSDEQLIGLWHQLQPIADLAYQNGLTPTRLEGQWRRLKRMGMLPGTRRLPPGPGRPKHSTSHSDTDGYRVAPLALADPLLERLAQLHADKKK